VAGARQAGVQLIYTRPTLGRFPYDGPYLRQLSKNTQTNPDDLALVGMEGDPDVWDDRIIDEVAPRDGDIVLRKFFNNAHTGTDLGLILRAQRAKTIVMSGIATESGIENNARWAVVEGFYSVIVTDAINSGSIEFHNNSLKYLERCADLVTTDELFNVWGIQ
jgi:isochorismate hydrolase